VLALQVVVLTPSTSTASYYVSSINEVTTTNVPKFFYCVRIGNSEYRSSFLPCSSISATDTDFATKAIAAPISP
jgi:hypothetical protein